MNKKVKLAFDLLEKEMEVVYAEEMRNYLGGTDYQYTSASGWYQYLTQVFGNHLEASRPAIHHVHLPVTRKFF